MIEFKEFATRAYARLRKLGVLHKIGYAQVWVQSKLFPPPPKGRFPPVWMSPPKPHGLVAIGGSMTPESLLCAYSKGIYPLYDSSPIEWLSCDPRMILHLENMKLKKGLRPLLKSGRYKVTFNTDFEGVVKACSEREWTWLVPERISAAVSLNQRGIAHSVEVWNQDGELVGGIFGIEVGRMFISESAFSKENNTMKVACAYLNCHLQHWGFAVNDVQAYAEHFRRLGYEEISRREYIKLLKELNTPPDKIIGKWAVDSNLVVGSWIPTEPGSQLRTAGASQSGALNTQPHF